MTILRHQTTLTFGPDEDSPIVEYRGDRYRVSRVVRSRDHGEPLPLITVYGQRCYQNGRRTSGDYPLHGYDIERLGRELIAAVETAQ